MGHEQVQEFDFSDFSSIEDNFAEFTLIESPELSWKSDSEIGIDEFSFGDDLSKPTELGVCPPLLDLNDSVDIEVSSFSFFNPSANPSPNTVFSFLSSENDAFEQMQNGKASEAHDILVDKIGMTEAYFGHIFNIVSSRSNSPSDSNASNGFKPQG